MALWGATAGVAAAGALAAPGLVGAAGPGAGPRIRVVYALHGEQQAGPDWPNKGFDFRPVMERYNAELPKRCPGFEFLPALATGPEEAAKILEQDSGSPVDGYLVFQMNCWNKVVQTFVPTNKPVLYADYTYAGSGGFLVYTAGFLRERARKESQAPRNSYELAFRNQFYTPAYVVAFLADNTLGRMWYEMRRGDTALTSECASLVFRPTIARRASGILVPPFPWRSNARPPEGDRALGTET